MEGDADTGVPLQRLNQRQVGMPICQLEDLREVVCRLVVMNSEAEVYAFHPSSEFMKVLTRISGKRGW